MDGIVHCLSSASEGGKNLRMKSKYANKDTEIQKQRTRRVSIRPLIPEWGDSGLFIGLTMPIAVESMGRGALSALL